MDANLCCMGAECTELLLDKRFVEAVEAAMGGTYDVLYAGIAGCYQHLGGFGWGARAIVYAGEYMAMYVEHARLLSVLR